MSELLVATRDRARWITMNRPQQLNALTWTMGDDLVSALADVSDVDAVVLTGSGRGFCAGIDLSVLTNEAAAPPEERRANLARAQQIVSAMSAAPCPVVAAVNGVAAGGGWGLALGADIIIAAASARFVSAFAQLSLVPDLGFGFNLTKRIGAMQAKSIIMLGRPLDADEALRLGAVDRVVTDSALDATVASLLPGIAAAGKGRWQACSSAHQRY